MATTEPVWAEPDQERVLAPAFLDGLREWPISELRARRRLAESAEQHLSFLRRMLQGRLDILTSEQRLRGTAGADCPRGFSAGDRRASSSTRPSASRLMASRDTRPGDSPSVAQRATPSAADVSRDG